MKFIDDIRRENLEALAESLGGVAGLARKLERSESQVSQWINGSSLPSGKKRGMKSETARWIEAIVGKPGGWLDTSHAPDDNSVRDPAVPSYAAHETPPPGPIYPLKRELAAIADRMSERGLQVLIYEAERIDQLYPRKVSP